jgi:Family of unknown function (DUF6074)
MKSDQPDLLSWRPATPQSALIIAFPLAKRHSKINRVAEMLSAKSGNNQAQATYWRRECTLLEKQMARAGLTPQVIDTQLRGFHAAVQSALYRRAYQGGGAA